MPIDARVQVGTSAPSTESVAEALNVTTAPLAFVAATEMFAGTVTVGGVVSPTVTVKVAVRVLPRVSDVLQLTVVIPRANVVPEAGEHVTGRHMAAAEHRDAL